MMPAIKFFLIPFVLLAFLILPAETSSQLVDRIVAVVNNEIITMSDVKSHRELFMEEENPEVLLENIINERLFLAEARKFQIPTPSETAIAQEADRVASINGGKRDLDTILKSLLVSRTEFNVLLESRIMIFRLLEQRVEFFVFVSEKNILDYAETHPDEFPEELNDRSHSIIYKRLMEEKTRNRKHEYIKRLRERANIRVN